MDAALITPLTFVPSADEALAELTPAVAAWFRATFGTPTAIQRAAWAVIRRGENALLAAPTGTGKTLAGLLPLLDCKGRGPTDGDFDGLRGLIITPLKALAADQFKNLAAVAQTIAGDEFRLGLRTGDTAPVERRRLRLAPPHVLWTTPESLAIQLTQASFRRSVASLRWVVVDEVHALAGDKRGCDLVISLERLEALACHGSLQRIGLSATCEPLDRVAEFLVGVGRSCRVIAVGKPSPIVLTVEPLPDFDSKSLASGFIARLIEGILPELRKNRTTLLFANNRNLCERVGWALKRRCPDRIDNIATHHSSLPGERRREIEHQLKEGRLWAVASSASLELGIDIGSVDGVVFIHPPGGVTRLLQRLGRAGHRPGVVRRGLLLCDAASELLEAAVTAVSGRFGQIEPIRIPQSPLDVLCQHLVGMALGQAWTREEALSLVRRATPFRDLTDDDFDACLRYLAGTNEAGDQWLPGRIVWLEGRFTIVSRRTARLMVRNLGTIVTEEPFRVRLLTNDGLIVGELDEPYADTLKPGDRFLLDGRSLMFVRREGQEMIARESAGAPMTPHWYGGGVRIAEELARRLFFVRAEAADALRDGPEELREFLANELHLGTTASESIAGFLQAQESASDIPDGQGQLIEVVDRGFLFEYALHTPLHAAANEAIARVLQRRLMKSFGGKVSILAVTLGVVVLHECDISLGEDAWQTLLDPEHFERDLQGLMRAANVTRQRFAKIAQTGLMVLRQPLGGKRRVGGRSWVERRLFDQLLSVDPEFVLLRQAKRETLTQTCDMAAALKYLAAKAHVRVRFLTETSPFAVAWQDAGEEAAHPHWHEVS